MLIRLKIILLTLLLSVTISEQAVAAEASETFNQNYPLLAEKNIFSRQRYLPRPDQRPIEQVRIVPKRYSSYILIGVSSINGTWNAFFENLLTGQCQIVKSGEIFEGGTIEAISESGVQYLRGEEKVLLVIGADMKGQTEVSGDTYTETPAASSSSGSTNIPADASETLRKLLERRNQETK